MLLQRPTQRKTGLRIISRVGPGKLTRWMFGIGFRFPPENRGGKYPRDSKTTWIKMRSKKRQPSGNLLHKGRHIRHFYMALLYHRSLLVTTNPEIRKGERRSCPGQPFLLFTTRRLFSRRAYKGGCFVLLWLYILARYVSNSCCICSFAAAESRRTTLSSRVLAYCRQ